MESLDTVACLVEDLLNFSSDVGEEDEEDHKPNRALASSLKPNGLLGPADSSIRPYHVSFMLCVFLFFLSFLWGG